MMTMSTRTTTAASTDVAALLRRLPLFSALTTELLAPLLTAVRERDLLRGEILFHRGDPSKGFYIVVSGQIKLAVSSEQGQEKVVEIISPQQSFGEAVMFMERPYPVFAQALLDSRLLFIGREAVSQLLDSEPAFGRAMLAGLSMRLHSLIADVESYALRSSTQRVIGYLLQHLAEHDGAAAVALPASKQVIASRLSLTPETFSRILHELTEARLIEVHGRQIMVGDLDRLRQFGL
jgi:CRP/FNR family transcriptional regulator, dissimilatory nitrate respiration regulator